MESKPQSHTCRHCGHEFVGRMCPMCGMPADWQRFTWRRLLNGFLDIWGMGNRPMFRSMGHLLWRPGYMIRDYLGGHYLSYFPPFKMLAVLTMLVVLTIWLLGIDTDATVAAAPIGDGEMAHYAILEGYQKVRNFLMGNALYALLLQIVVLVAAVWLVFRRRGLNFVETFFAMVYISCQMQMVVIVWLLLTQTLIRHSLFPFSLPEVVVVALLVFDFRQLFSLSTWGAVWRTLLVTLVLLLLYLAFMFTAVVILIAAVGVERLIN
ncbi:MAG: DUF3667 domain-containing protein [Prevotella sp.]|nr:DUF3667 domain-containing protein [Prevotella sp.]